MAEKKPVSKAVDQKKSKLPSTAILPAQISPNPVVPFVPNLIPEAIPPQFNLTKLAKEALPKTVFDDPDGIPQLPASFQPHSWRRITDLYPTTKDKTVKITIVQPKGDQRQTSLCQTGGLTHYATYLASFFNAIIALKSYIPAGCFFVGKSSASRERSPPSIAREKQVCDSYVFIW
jgi:hypothetical protein